MNASLSKLPAHGDSASDGPIGTPVEWFGLPGDPVAGDIGSTPAMVGAAAALRQVLYLTEVGDGSAINVDDIHQGQLGDCFLLSAIGEIALYHPAAISAMIQVGTGGETVSLYAGLNGHLAGFGATGFKATTQGVTNSFAATSVNSGAMQDVLNGQKEIWVQVLEKAYAQADGGYAGIQNGGNPCIALQALTGHVATWQSPASTSAAVLQQDSAAGDLIVMDTGPSANLPFGLVGSHAYMFEGLQTVAGAACVRLGNPWGFDQPALIPVSQLSKAVVEVDVGHLR